MKRLILSKNEYDAMIETIEIQSNQYLMRKIVTGQREVNAAKLQSHDLINTDKDNE